MDAKPTQGPVQTSKPQKPHDFSRFDHLMEVLERWRADGQENYIALWRDDVIEIIDGVKAMRR